MKRHLFEISVFILSCVLFFMISSCNNNDSNKQPQPSLQATEHTHKWGEWEAVENASCLKEGKEKRTCACGESETNTLPRLEHKEVITPGTPPTCLKSGTSDRKYCSVCYHPEDPTSSI